MVATLAVLYVCFNFFISPLKVKIDAKNQIIAEEKEKYASIKKLKTTNKNDTIRLKDIKLKYDEGVKALPQNDRNPEIFLNLNTIAIKSNIKMNSVVIGSSTSYSVQDAANASSNKSSSNSVTSSGTKTTGIDPNLVSNIKFVQATIAITGNYSNIINFVGSIEEDNRLNEIQSITITANGDKTIGLQATIITNYYFKEDTSNQQQSYDFKDNNGGKADLFN